MTRLGNITQNNNRVWGIGVGLPSEPGNSLFVGMFMIFENYDNIL